jgi:hypothetical protein
MHCSCSFLSSRVQTQPATAMSICYGPVRFSYELHCFSEGIMFFSYNKSANAIAFQQSEQGYAISHVCIFFNKSLLPTQWGRHVGTNRVHPCMCAKVTRDTYPWLPQSHSLPGSKRSRVPVPVTPDPVTFLQATTTIYSKSAPHSKLQHLLITHQYDSMHASISRVGACTAGLGERISL